MDMDAPKWKTLNSPFVSPCSGAAQLHDLLCANGEHSDIVLRKTKLFHSDLLKLDKQISPKQYAQLCFNATLSSGCAELAIKLGRQVLPSALGPWASGLIHAPDLGRALDFLISTTYRWSPLIDIQRRIENGKAHYLVYDAYGLLDDPLLKQFVMLSTFEAVRQSCEWLAGKHVCAHWQYTFEGSGEKLQWEAFSSLGELALFNQPYSAFSISEMLLATPLNQSCSSIYHATQKKVLHEKSNSTGIVEIVRVKVNDSIQNIPSMEDIARSMSISTATLKRNLKQHNTSYQSIVDDCRAKTTYFLLNNKNMSEKEVAQHLNFYDVSNLRRAMKKWLVLG